MQNFDDIYEVVKLIPEGRATSYGAIANYLGSKGGARLVGWAMGGLNGRNDVPAHRVVNQKGMLSGKNAFRTPDLMQQLLEAEGIMVEKDQIKNFDRVFWDPSIELS